ncbi:MAG: ABC transporter permease, partial [Actinobacteria bacterium]|nr:ABC transporter permease [Actinomycetota bacterium]
MNRSTSLVVGGSLVALIATLAFLASVWTPYDPLVIDTTARFSSPSWQHWLGTDQLGRDVLSNLLVGSRTSLTAALAATMIAMTVGAALGIAAAVSPRWLDGLFS